jgi:hypothetical protein
LKKNINGYGRLFRFAIAIALLVVSYLKHSWIAFGFGVFVLFEAAFSWCILYQILGKNSCPKD